MVRAAKLSFTTAPGDGELVIVLRGVIDEDSTRTFRDLVPILQPRTAFDMQGVDAINSCGLAEWVSFIERHGEKRQFRLDRCSPAFVNCLNLSPAVRGNAQVRSVMITLQCRQDHTQQRLLTAEEAATATEVAEACHRCRGQARPQVDLEDYLAFLRD